MQFRKLVAGATALAIASTLALAGPAQADTTSSTPLELTLAAGELSITAPTTAVTLTDATVTVTQYTGAVDTTVTDQRNSLLGWVVSAAVTDFSDGGSNSIPALAVTMQIDPATVITSLNDGQTFVPGAAVAGSGVVGTMLVDTNLLDLALGSNNSVNYDLGVTVNVPVGTPDGVYTSTLTQTVV